MKGIYLSGPITGNEEAAQDFARAEELVKNKIPAVRIFNPMKLDEATPRMSHDDYLELDLFIIDKFCDTLFLINGWKASLGAREEYGFAKAKDYSFIYESEGELRIINERYGTSETIL